MLTDIKYPLLLSDFNQTGISRQIFEKFSNVIFHENATSGIRVVHADKETLRSSYSLFANLRTHLKRECIGVRIFVAIVKCSTKRNPLIG